MFSGGGQSAALTIRSFPPGRPHPLGRLRRPRCSTRPLAPLRPTSAPLSTSTQLPLPPPLLLSLPLSCSAVCKLSLSLSAICTRAFSATRRLPGATGARAPAATGGQKRWQRMLCTACCFENCSDVCFNCVSTAHARLLTGHAATPPRPRRQLPPAACRPARRLASWWAQLFHDCCGNLMIVACRRRPGMSGLWLAAFRHFWTHTHMMLAIPPRTCLSRWPLPTPPLEYVSPRLHSCALPCRIPRAAARRAATRR
jgi:hypothetical protein